MRGKCPYCERNAEFREESFGELTTSLFKGIGSFLSKSNVGKAATVVGEVTGGTWKNYVCTSCNRKSHECGGCGSMERYQDFGAVCSKCGYR